MSGPYRRAEEPKPVKPLSDRSPAHLYTDELRVCKWCGSEFVFKAAVQAQLASVGFFCTDACRLNHLKAESDAYIKRLRLRKRMRKEGYLL